jgi:hypothetical protein
MHRNRFRHFCIVTALIGEAVAGTPVTPNLLVNGDAETQRCTADWTAQTSVPGWRVTRGAASVLCYSAFSYAGEAPVLPTSGSGGEALFAAPGADTAMEQSVDISAAASAIDHGTVGFALSGWLGGWDARPERAVLTATFVDASGNATGVPVTIANVDASTRKNVTALVQREADGLVPAGTRQIIITVQFLSGLESYSNAFADNLSLTLNGSIAGLAPATLTPPESTVPALDHVYVFRRGKGRVHGRPGRDRRQASRFLSPDAGQRDLGLPPGRICWAHGLVRATLDGPLESARTRGISLEYTAIPYSYPLRGSFAFGAESQRSLFQYASNCAAGRLWSGGQDPQTCAPRVPAKSRPRPHVPPTMGISFASQDFRTNIANTCIEATGRFCSGRNHAAAHHHSRRPPAADRCQSRRHHLV